MTNIIKATTISSENAMDEIEKVTKLAAKTLTECLDTVDITMYVHFLDTMYHYTLNTGSKSLSAAKDMPYHELEKFFKDFEKEEHWHYKLAVQDLKSFGKIPTQDRPDIIKMFDGFWLSLSGKHYTGYLGALYVFENIAKYVKDDVVCTIDRLGLSRKESRWLSVHAEEDIQHGKIVQTMLSKHIDVDPVTAVNSARQAAKLWEAIMLYAFTPSITKVAA